MSILTKTQLKELRDQIKPILVADDRYWWVTKTGKAQWNGAPIAIANNLSLNLDDIIVALSVTFIKQMKNERNKMINIPSVVSKGSSPHSNLRGILQ
jgi:hypothetical protein